MRKAIFSGAFAALLVCGATTANAQTAQGRANGTTLDVLGTNVVTQGDTGAKNAPNPSNTPNPNGFDGNAGPATLPLSPLAEVVTGPSRTRGCAVPSACPELFPTPGGSDFLDPSLSNETFVRTTAGDATVALLPATVGGADLLDAVSSGSSLTVRCNNDTEGTVSPQAEATSQVNALVVGGTVIPIPGNSAPNTTILAPQLPLIVLNEQNCSITTTSASCTVSALHAQLVTMSELLDLKLSNASGSITFDPAQCQCNGPLLSNSSKRGDVQTAAGAPKNPPAAPTDKILYTVNLINSGCVTAEGVRIVDRIPRGTTFVPGSVKVGGTAMAGIAPAPCSADEDFDNSCPGEKGVDTARQCLTVSGITVPVSTTPTQVTFTVTVDSGSTGGNNPGCNNGGVGEGFCNAVLIHAQGLTVPVARTNQQPCPNGTPTPSGTQTPGGGATATPGGGGTPSGTGTPRGTQTPSGTRTPGTPLPTRTDRLVTTGGGGCSIGGNGGSSAQTLPLLGVGLLLGIRQWRRRAARAKS